jgi:hypothetical protein
MSASAAQTSPLFTVVDWERHGGILSSAVPPGHALPLTDFIELGQRHAATTPHRQLSGS